MALSDLRDGVTYQMKMVSSHGAKVSYGGTDYLANKYFSISATDLQAGSLTVAYTGTAEGSHDITYSIKSSEGIEVSQTTALTFSKIKPHSFTISNAKNQAELDEAVNQTMALSDLRDGVTYQMKMVSSHGAKVRYGGTDYLANKYFSISATDLQAGSLTVAYTGTAEGSHDITYSIKSSEGIEVSQTTALTFSKIKPHSFTISNAKNQAELDEAVNQTMALSDLRDGVTYQMKMVSSHGAKVRYGGTDYLANKYFSISATDLQAGSLTVAYTGTAEGSHDITYSIKSSEGIEVSQTTALTFSKIKPHSFTISNAKNQAELDEAVNQTMALSDLRDGVTYQMKMVSSHGARSAMEERTILPISTLASVLRICRPVL